MKSLERKLSKLEDQKQKIVEEIDNLKRTRNTEILHVLDSFPPHKVDAYTIIGGLLYVMEQAQNQDEIVGDWQRAGEKFCRRSGNKKSSEFA